MRVSVALCTYQGERHIEEQLRSLLVQSRPPDELIICDDRSTDDTVAVARKALSGAPFAARVEVNEHRLGVVGNFGKAIGLATGDVIALCDQDDIWAPAKLATMERLFERRPDLLLAFSDAALVDEELRPLGATALGVARLSDHDRGALSTERAFDLLLTRCVVPGNTMVFRSALREAALPFPPTLADTEGLMIHDRWLLMVAAAVGHIGFTDESLLQYRQHAGQQIGLNHLPPAWRPYERVRRWMTPGFEDQSAELIGFTALRDHLAAMIGPDVSTSLDRYLERLTARMAHSQARAALPMRRRHRARPILAELLSGRYRSYSRGYRSALKDLVTSRRLEDDTSKHA